MNTLGHESRVRECPICGQPPAERLYSQRFSLPEGHPLEGGYDVVVCDRCDVGFASSIPDQSEFDRYYEELSKYASISVTSGSGVHAWDRARLDSMAKRVAQYALPRGAASIADVGCGSGGSLPHYAQAGFSQVIGVDPSAACVQAANAGLEERGLSGRAFQGTFDSLPTEAAQADVYVLSHVLEHVRDVIRSLRALRRTAHASSLLYLEVPDASRFVDFPASPLLEFNTEHINYFTVQSLARAAAGAGWNVIDGGQDTIPNGPQTWYPTTWVIASVADVDERIGASESIRASLGRYIRQEVARLEHVDQQLARRPITGSVAIWGTGQTTAILLANSSLGTADIRAFVDSDPRFIGRRIQGAPVVPIAHIRNHPDWTIFIASVLAEQSIRMTLRDQSLANPVVSLTDLLA